MLCIKKFVLLLFLNLIAVQSNFILHVSRLCIIYCCIAAISVYVDYDDKMGNTKCLFMMMTEFYDVADSYTTVEIVDSNGRIKASKPVEYFPETLSFNGTLDNVQLCLYKIIKRSKLHLKQSTTPLRILCVSIPVLITVWSGYNKSSSDSRYRQPEKQPRPSAQTMDDTASGMNKIRLLTVEVRTNYEPLWSYPLSQRYTFRRLCLQWCRKVWHFCNSDSRLSVPYQPVLETNLQFNRRSNL